MNKIESCRIICLREYTATELKIFEEKINDGYRVHWYVTRDVWYFEEGCEVL